MNGEHGSTKMHFGLTKNMQNISSFQFKHASMYVLFLTQNQ